MQVQTLLEIIGSDFYTGVPDSQLKALCGYLIRTYGTDPKHHIIAANEGNCAALAAGYHLATGKVPVVYMQNSGEGNIINPAASLLNERVYGIPVVFIVGWRGEPGIHDEPQHIYQGQITTEEEVRAAMTEFRPLLEAGKDVAFVIRKGALTDSVPASYSNPYTMGREEIIRHIAAASGKDPIVSTTGKASRELFEIRAANGQSHKYDFLTVGSMGHSSSIALGVALNQPYRRVWCIDGDGSVLMHMGAMAVIGAYKPENLIHVVINNEAHETVGGMPTVAGHTDLVAVAKACGYPYAARVERFEDLDRELAAAKARRALTFLEVKAALGARADLGRPTTTALENKKNFMRCLAETC